MLSPHEPGLHHTIMAQSMKSCVDGRDTQLIHVQLYKSPKHIIFIVIMMIAIIFIIIAIIIIILVINIPPQSPKQPLMGSL